MKKLLNFTFFTALLLLISSCQSDSLLSTTEDVETLQTEKRESLFSKNQFKENKLLMAKIDNFRERLYKTSIRENTSRDFDPLSPEETAWNYAALLNAYFTDVSSPFSALHSAETTFNVPIGTDGIISDERVYQGYLELRNVLRNHYFAAPYSSKHTTATQVELLGVQDGQANFKLKSFVGKKEDVPPFEPFALPHYWNEDSDCTVSSAQVALTAALNTRLDDNYSEAWFVVEEFVNLMGNAFADVCPNIGPGVGFPLPYPQGCAEYWRTPNDVMDGYRDFRIFRTSPDAYGEETLCINPDDMNWYYYNLEGEISALINQLNAELNAGTSPYEFTYDFGFVFLQDWKQGGDDEVEGDEYYHSMLVVSGDVLQNVCYYVYPEDCNPCDYPAELECIL